MAIEREDLDIIKKELDDRYVKQADCDDRQAEISKKFAYDDKRLDMIGNDVAGFKKLGWIAISALIGEFVLSFLDLFKGV